MAGFLLSYLVPTDSNPNITLFDNVIRGQSYFYYFATPEKKESAPRGIFSLLVQ